MFDPITRRRFVTSTAPGSLAAGFAFLNALPEVKGAADPVLPKVATVASDIEPLVRLIEDTKRGEVINRVVERIHKGTSYQELLSAVFLAGVRGIQPRPVGFKFHAVLVINSAHLASLSATDKDRWLPLLWSIDNFKASQARNATEGDWHMAAVQESKLPAEEEAPKRFTAALDNWDVEGADTAVAAWTRAASASEVFEPLWRYGARDFRSIGHKAIYVANAWRTLQTIGWRHAEPIMRSLAYALLEHEGSNPSKRDDFRDKPGRDNLARVEKLATFRHAGRREPTISQEVLTTQRKCSAEQACEQINDLIKKGVHPASIWDGLFLTAGEMLMRQPGIVGLHTLTTMNALHFAYQTSSVPATRAFVLLQAGAFLPLFRKTMQDRGKMSSAEVDGLEAAEVKEDAVAAVLADVSKDRMAAAWKTPGLLKSEPEQLPALMREARRLIFAKGSDSHDYKFSSAVLEDAYSLTPALRPAFMATSMFNLRGSGDRDNGLIQRAREALTKA